MKRNKKSGKKMLCKFMWLPLENIQIIFLFWKSMWTHLRLCVRSAAPLWATWPERASCRPRKSFKNSELQVKSGLLKDIGMPQSWTILLCNDVLFLYRPNMYQLWHFGWFRRSQSRNNYDNHNSNFMTYWNRYTQPTSNMLTFTISFILLLQSLL